MLVGQGFGPAACFLAGALLSVLLTGCGTVGEPLYPALNIPTRISDLGAVERGDKIEISFTIPPLTTEGLALKQIGSVELRVGPNTGSEFRPDEWAANAKRIDVPLPSKPGAVQVSAPAAEFIGKTVVVEVRVGNARGRMSAWSNPVVVTIETPLAAPTGLRAEAVGEGVRVAWTAAAGQNAFRIYRRADKEKEATLLATSDKPEYLDTNTEYGKPYDYYVQSTHEKTESTVTGPSSVTPIDTFAPAVPAGVTASAGVNTIELAWERNTEVDFKQYRVYRSEEGGPFVKIAEGLESPAYSDRTITTGKHYRYQITAADQAANESKPSEPVEAIVP